jgi:hypothetical protein
MLFGHTLDAFLCRVLSSMHSGEGHFVAATTMDLSFDILLQLITSPLMLLVCSPFGQTFLRLADEVSRKVDNGWVLGMKDMERRWAIKGHDPRMCLVSQDCAFGG